ncbi:MAG: hypothetical protein M0D57_19060 [Sphingobacteriales bacterium JAD_PAG50586_3]|nr:MAG: hypothetical protein M0D57_19060 [Sphingobacteriales bacterium JAD_PAG50586_3]
MKKALKIFAVIAGILFILGISIFFYFRSLFSFDEKYFEGNSGIKLPEGYEVVTFIDDGEMTALAEIQLPKDKVEAFISDNELKQFSNEFTVLRIRFGLLGNDYNLPGKNSFSIKDCGECNCWEYVVDKDKGILWAQIDYPDYSGDCPTGKNLRDLK